jgi:hypothetical protein
MKILAKLSSIAVLGTLTVFSLTPTARAGAHTWQVWEVFTNADGTIQFLELRETGGGAFETGITGHIVSASPSGGNYTIAGTIASPTGNRSYLIATAGFAALPGAPTPDEIMPDRFFDGSDTSTSYTPYNTATWALGALPQDGIHSLTRTAAGSVLVSAVNSPTNYAGGTGTVDASPGAGLAGVPGLQASRLAADGSSISVSFNNGACTGAVDTQIVYGQRSGFPAVAGGTYTPLGGTCNIGTASPFTWNATPSANDGSGLVWFLVVNENNAGNEGPWGTYNGTVERSGPGLDGSSGVCGITDKVVSNTCGH